MLLVAAVPSSAALHACSNAALLPCPAVNMQSGSETAPVTFWLGLLFLAHGHGPHREGLVSGPCHL